MQEEIDVEVVMALFPKLNQAIADIATMENADKGQFMTLHSHKKLEDLIFQAIKQDMSDFR
mgnify:FL=1